MIQLNTFHGNPQFITIQPLYFDDTAVIKDRLLNKYPEMKRYIYAVDEEEILIQLPTSELAYPMPLKDLVATVKETGIKSLIAVVVANGIDSDEYGREYVQYYGA